MGLPNFSSCFSFQVIIDLLLNHNWRWYCLHHPVVSPSQFQVPGMKIPLYQHKYSHYKDKRVVRQSYFDNGNPHAWKDWSPYQDWDLVHCESVSMAPGPWLAPLPGYCRMVHMPLTHQSYLGLAVWRKPQECILHIACPLCGAAVCQGAFDTQRFDPSHAEFIFGNLFQHWDGTSHWNPLS